MDTNIFSTATAQVSPKTSNIYVIIYLSLFALTATLFAGLWAPWQAAQPLLLSLWAVVVLWQLPTAPLPSLVRWGILLPTTLTLIWATAQQLPASWIGSTPHPLYGLAPSIALWPALGANVPAGILQLLQLGSLLLGWLAMVQLCRNPNTPTPLAKGFALITLAIATYGLIIFLLGNQSVLWQPKFTYQNSLTATFINRNHFATFAGLGMLTCLALFLQRIGEISAQLTTQQRLKAFWQLVIRPHWPWLMAALYLFVIILLTSSRAGLAAAAAGTLALLGGLIYARPSTRFPLAALLGGGTLIALALLAIIGSTLAGRLTTLATDTSARAYIYEVAQQTASQQPLTGHGLGAFQAVAEASRSGVESLKAGGVIDHAHNTYLEFAAELGLPATFLLAIAVFCTLAILINGLLTRRRAVIWPALGTAAFTLLASHALADFSLSIPAVQLAALALVALGVGQAFAPAESPHPQRTTALIASLAAAPIMLASAVLAWGYSPYLSPAVNIALHPTLVAPPATLIEARDNLLQASQRLPWLPQPQLHLTQVNFALAGLNATKAGKITLQAQAALHLQQALALNPGNGQAWLWLAQVEITRNNSTQAQQALINSLLTSPAEPTLAIQRILLLLQLYPQANADDQALMAQQVTQLWTYNRWRLAAIVKPWPELRQTMGQILVQKSNTLPEKLQTNLPREWQALTRTPLPSLGN